MEELFESDQNEYVGCDLTRSTFIKFGTELNLGIIKNTHKNYKKRCLYSVQKLRLKTLKNKCFEKIENGENVNDVCNYYENKAENILWKGVWNYFY